MATTDLVVFKQLLDKAGIAYTAQDDGDGHVVVRLETKTPNVEGYVGFAADFTFNGVGALLRAGVWEG